MKNFYVPLIFSFVLGCGAPIAQEATFTSLVVQREVCTLSLQDDEEAVKWYRLAAEQSDADAQNALGSMHYNGHGLTQDYEEAAKWYRLAAEQGLALAQVNLGLLYAYASGVLQDYIRAHMWLDVAAANGYDDARKWRDELAKHMTPSQIESAEALAKECLRSKYKDC